MTHPDSPCSDLTDAVRQILTRTLHLGARGAALTPDTPLLGALAELDSMAVVQVLAALESEFDLCFDEGELNAGVFATLGSLSAFVAQQQSA
jgi:acyl carrier protein